MGKELEDLKESLASKSYHNKVFRKGIEIMKEIIADFDTISDKALFSLTQEKIDELAEINSKSYENRIAIGFDKSGFNYSCIKEINKQKILQDYKERNLSKWQEIIKIGHNSMVIIAWGVAVRRKAIPVFLDDNELRMFGYGSGLIEEQVYEPDAEYYDSYVYPPSLPGPDIDVRWYKIKQYSRGMRNQWIYLRKFLFADKVKQNNLPEEGVIDIMFATLKHPEILRVIFENMRELEKTNNEKVSKLESEMLVLYEELSEEKQAEALERMKKTKELDGVRSYIRNNVEVYLLANEHRRNGLPLNKGLELAIDVLKDKNEHLKTLLFRNNNDINAAINSLHNSYYKSKYKDFNKF